MQKLAEKYSENFLKVKPAPDNKKEKMPIYHEHL